MNIYNCNYFKKFAYGFESEQRKDHEHILEVLNIKESDNILEIGCGLGRLLKKIPSQKKIGIDISEAAIDECKKYGLMNVLICDAENGLPFEKYKFDIVILNEVLEHFKNPKYVLSEIHRVLKNDGRVLITTPIFHSIFITLFTSHEGHFSEMTIKDIRLLLNNCNFKILIHKVNGLFFLSPFLEILFFRPFRFLRKKSKSTIKIDELQKFADRKILKFLSNYRESFKNLGQSQLILAEKQVG